MADKGPGSTNRSPKKRLARAKIKQTEYGIKSSKGRVVKEDELSKAEQKRERQKKLTAIGIGAFAVIMALSMMLPSLSYIFGNGADQAAEEQAAKEQAAKQEEQESEAEAEEQESATGIDLVDANYAAVVDPLEAKLSENPEDLATILNLGNDYMAWASEASVYASDDAGSAHVTELYDKAIGYFDQYLGINDSAVVKSNRAMCHLYKGDADAALQQLQDVTSETPDYGPAWVNIGIIKEYQGDTDAAKEAYQKAVEADPNDEYGAKSQADRRLAALAAAEGGDVTADAAGTTDATTTDGAEALENALDSGL
jgi:tetratricopeptide (TPR) repeat protein